MAELIPMSLGTLTGSLKQQVDEGDANYEWRKRHFTFELDRGKLVAKEDGKVINLDGALYAKAWSISSPAVGYGFDIVWSDGTMISFIASEEADCATWVNGINASIKFNSEGDGTSNRMHGDLLDTILDNNLPQAPSAQAINSKGTLSSSKPPLPGATSGIRRGRSDDETPDRHNSRGSSPISEMSDTHIHRKMARGEGILNASSIATVGSDHSHYNTPAHNHRTKDKEEPTNGNGKNKSVVSDMGGDELLGAKSSLPTGL